MLSLLYRIIKGGSLEDAMVPENREYIALAACSIKQLWRPTLDVVPSKRILR